MKDGYRTNFEGESAREDFDTMSFYSNFNKDRLNSIYSNLDTISFYKLMTEKDELVYKGYNSKLLEEKKHFYLSLPFFLVLMVCLALIFTLNSNERRQNAYYLIFSITACALIFYFKKFFDCLRYDRKNSFGIVGLGASSYFVTFLFNWNNSDK